MSKRIIDATGSHWRFRREVTLGTVLHLAVLLIMAATAWSNLQKELAIIQHDLTRLVASNVHLQEHIDHLSATIQSHECRLGVLEQRKVLGKESLIDTDNGDWDSG